MTDPERRPRPQYGEYATPEEQRARIKDPSAHPFGSPAQPSAGERGSYGERSGVPIPPIARADVPEETAQPSARQRATNRGVDRIATLALLALGLYSVLSTLVTMADLAGYLDSTMKQLGIGSYTATPTTAVIAVVISVVNVVAWLVSAPLSMLSLRAGRISFWIPLTAGVVVTVITAICYAVLLMSDPSFVASVTRSA
jgi:hypothetical protein